MSGVCDSDFDNVVNGLEQQISQKDEMISLLEGALDKISNLTECGMSENIADEALYRLNELRKEQINE